MIVVSGVFSEFLACYPFVQKEMTRAYSTDNLREIYLLRERRNERENMESMRHGKCPIKIKRSSAPVYSFEMYSD